MKMKNTDIRALISKNGLYLYQVAAAMEIKQNTLSHYLMKELTKPQKDRIKEAIKTAKARKANNEEKEKDGLHTAEL